MKTLICCLAVSIIIFVFLWFKSETTAEISAKYADAVAWVIQKAKSDNSPTIFLLPKEFSNRSVDGKALVKPLGAGEFIVFFKQWVEKGRNSKAYAFSTRPLVKTDFMDGYPELKLLLVIDSDRKVRYEYEIVATRSSTFFEVKFDLD